MRIKTRPITAILTSAYLSAMLTSSLAPVRNNAIFAAAVDPTAAEKALQNAVSGLNAAGWAAAATPAASPAAPEPVPVTVTPMTDPVMNEELMARLIKRTLASKKPTTAPAIIVNLLGLGTEDLPVKQISEKMPEGKHFFIVPTHEGAKDIILGFKSLDGSYTEFYLTDKTGALRAAGTDDANGPRLITNEQAAAKYAAELKLFAKLAQDLPPAGAAVAGNS